MPKEPPEEIIAEGKEFPKEYLPLARGVCEHLILREPIGKGKKKYFCSNCDESYELDGVRRPHDEFTYDLWSALHGGRSHCIKCGAEATVIDGRRWALDRHWCYAPLVVRKQLKDKRQAILCFDLARRFYYSERYGFSQEIRASLDDVYLLDEGSAGHYKYYYYGQRYCKFRYKDDVGEKFRGGFGEPFANHTSSTGNMCYKVYDVGKWNYGRDILKYMPEELKSSRSFPCAAMASFAVYPQLEMLYKMGFEDIVKNVIYHGKKCVRVCNIKGRSFKEVFPKFEKSELKGLSWSNHGDVVYAEMYLRIRKIYGGDRRYAKEVLDFVRARYSNTDEVIRNISRTKFMPHVAIRYFEKLAEGYGDNAPEWARYNYSSSKAASLDKIYKHWCDYIDAAEAIGFDLTREDVVFPKDLHKRHNVAVKLHREILAEKQVEELKELWQKNEKIYGFSDGEYVIVNPKSTYEIIDEGKAQGHCVAGYAERHANGTLAIVFIRRVGDEDDALLTVEMRKQDMIQVRGKKNRPPDAHEQEFVDKWLSVVRERFEGPKKKNIKRKENTAMAVGANV